MWLLSGSLLWSPACRGVPPAGAAPTASSPPAAIARIGAEDRLAFRFLDHADEATVTGPLRAAWRTLSLPSRLADPYRSSSGETAPRVAEIALADADVATYAQPGRAGAPRSAPTSYDPVWNRTRAVYQSKAALFVPADSRYVFSVPAVPAGKLRCAIALPPGGAPVTLAVNADGRSVFARTVGAAEAGRWIAVEITLPATPVHEVAFSTTSAKVGAAAFFGDPVLVEPSAGPARTNVLLVVIDTLRADALPVMPRLSALAARGASFTQAITAATWTRPSILAMLGGDYASALGQGAEAMIPSDRERRRFYATAPPLLPRLLEAQGYGAFAIGNNFFLLGYPQIGLTFGFDEVDDIRHPVEDTPAIARAARAFIAAHAHEPWLLYLHFDAPHWPYTPPAAYLARGRPPLGFPSDPMARAYLAEAAYADDHLGQVLDALEAEHLTARTLVVVAGDHGEIFDHAHAHTVVALKDSTLHHHGWSAYDELLRVPLVVSQPGTVPAARVDAQVRSIDVLPTILALAGLPAPKGRRGRSLVPLFTAPEPEERVAFTEGQNVRAVRAGGWAYLKRGDPRLILSGERRVAVPEELYELARDPTEHVDRAGDRSAPLERLRALFQREAPRLPVVQDAVAHLQRGARESPGSPDLIEGTLRSDGTVQLRGVDRARAEAVNPHTVRVALEPSGRIDFVTDPPDAKTELSLLPTAGRLLVGPYALPLFGHGPVFELDDERWSWLDSPRTPYLGEGDDLFVWRDPGAHGTALPLDAGANREVAGMMKRWGYAH
jgi:arylsulfatase A-like enzyme